MSKLSASSKLFIALVVLAGLGTMADGLLHWECRDLVRFFAFLLIASLASRLKVSLPGVNGNMSVNLPFLLIAIAELSLGEAVVIAAVSTLVQCLPSGGRRMQPVQVLFNLSTVVVAVAASAFTLMRADVMANLAGKSLWIALAGAAYLVANTVPVAGVISLTESKNVAKIWYDIFALTFPYFGLAAAIASITVTASHYVGWQTPLFIAPVMVLTYGSFRRMFRASAPMQLRASAAAAD